MNPTVVIDYLPESAAHYRDGHAPWWWTYARNHHGDYGGEPDGGSSCGTRTSVHNVSTLKNPLMVGEIGGNTPYGFDLTNSPVQIARRSDRERPIIFVSSSGTQLILSAEGRQGVYLACFRNFSAVAEHIAHRHERIALIGAGTRGQFRREDQMGCAWVAEKLVKMGYRTDSGKTDGYISRWSGVSPEEAREGKSAEYLMRSSQKEDLEFVIGHFDDLKTVPVLKNGELVQAANEDTRYPPRW